MKLKEFQTYLAENDIDLAVFVHPDKSISYFTQIPEFSFAVLIIPPHGKPDVYLTSLDKKPNVKDFNIKKLQRNWVKSISKEKPRNVGINKQSISLAFYEKIKKECPVSFVDVGMVVDQLRSKKTSEELTRIKKACKITTNVFKKLINNFNFKTELDVSNFIDIEINKMATNAFPTIAASGTHAAIPHHVPENCPLKSGFLLLDFGARYKNYCSDMSRTVYIGTPSKKEKERYELLLDVQVRTIEHNNDSCKQLAKFSRKKLGKYSSHFIHSLGHGIGIEEHEAPSINIYSEEVLNESTTFTIEPGVYFPQKYGIRIEDTLVKKKWLVPLTKAPKGFIRL